MLRRARKISNPRLREATNAPFRRRRLCPPLIFVLLNRLTAYEVGIAPTAAVHLQFEGVKLQVCSGVISAAKITPAAPQCVRDIFLRLVGCGAFLHLPLPIFVRLMHFQRTLRRRQRAALAGVDELYVFGVDGGERSGGMRVLGSSDPRFLQHQKKATPHAGVRLPLRKPRGRGGGISVVLLRGLPRL